MLASEGFDRRFVIQLADLGFAVAEVPPAEVHPHLLRDQPANTMP